MIDYSMSPELYNELVKDWKKEYYKQMDDYVDSVWDFSQSNPSRVRNNRNLHSFG